MRKNKKVVVSCFCLAAVCYLILSVSRFTDGDTGPGIMWLALAVVQGCIAASWVRRSEKTDSEEGGNER